MTSIPVRHETSNRLVRGADPDAPHITCPVCGMTSYHLKDIAHGCCGNCHEFTGRKDRDT